MEHITFSQYAFDFWVVPFIIFIMSALPLWDDKFQRRIILGLKFGGIAAAFTHLSAITLLF